MTSRANPLAPGSLSFTTVWVRKFSLCFERTGSNLFLRLLDPVENGFDVFDDAPLPEPMALDEEMPEMEDLTAVMVRVDFKCL
jgi:hypothetical protein